MATIWEGQFSEDKLHGLGRRYIVSMDEELYFYDIGYWKKGLLSGYAKRNYNGKLEEGLYEEECIKIKVDEKNPSDKMA